MPNESPPTRPEAASTEADTAGGRWRPVKALVWVNAALLVALAAVTLSPRATAQQAAPRASGKYMVVGAQPISGNSNVVYIIDSVNAEMVGLMWNQSRRTVDGVGFRDIDEDLTRTPQR